MIEKEEIKISYEKFYPKLTIKILLYLRNIAILKKCPIKQGELIKLFGYTKSGKDSKSVISRALGVLERHNLILREKLSLEGRGNPQNNVFLTKKGHFLTNSILYDQLAENEIKKLKFLDLINISKEDTVIYGIQRKMKLIADFIELVEERFKDLKKIITQS